MLRAEYYGKLGSTTRYYWLVVQFASSPNTVYGPAIVQTTGVLNNDNRVLLKWDYVPGAIYYVVVQTPTNTPPVLQTNTVKALIAVTPINYATDTGIVEQWNYPNPTTGGSGASGVLSFNTRTGAVVPTTGDYDVNQITNAVSKSRLIIAGLGLNGGGSLANDVSLAVTPDSTIQKGAIYNSGVPIGQRSTLNLIGGSALTISASDNPGQNWIDVVFSSKTGSGSGLVDPTVAKGDLMVRNNTQVVRFPVGTDGQTLVSDSTQPTGLRWGAGAGQTPWLQPINGNGMWLTNASGISISPISGGGDDFPSFDFNFGAGSNSNSRITSFIATEPGIMEFTHNLYRDSTTRNLTRDDPTKGSSLMIYAREAGFPNGGPYLSLTGYDPAMIRFAQITLDAFWGFIQIQEGNVTSGGSNYTTPALIFATSGNSDKARIDSPYGTSDLVLSSKYFDAGSLQLYRPLFNLKASNIASFQYDHLDANTQVHDYKDALTIDIKNQKVGVNQATPAYNLDVVGDCNITGVYRVNGVPLVTGGGGQPQTPWAQDIDGGGHTLDNVMEIDVTDSIWFKATGYTMVSLYNNQGVLESNQGFRTAGAVNTGTNDRTYQLNVGGDVNITGVYRVNGVPISTGGGSLAVQDEGAAIASQSTLNFIGAGVSAANDSANSRINITIPGGGAGSQTPWTQDINAATFKLNNTGNVGIGANASTQARLLVSSNAATVPLPPVGGTVIHAAALDSANPRILLDGWGGTPAFVGRMAGGTAASPSAVTIFLNLAQFGALARGATTYSTVSRGHMGVYASEGWTDTAQGTYLSFYITPSGGTATAEKVRIDSTGNVGMGGKTNPGYALDITGDCNVSGAFRVNGVALSAGSQTPWTQNIDGGGFTLTNTGAVTIGGNLTFGTDNTYDIGASAANRPRNFYLAGSMIGAGNITCGLGNGFIVSTRSKLVSAADGNFTMQNNAGGSFTTLQFGGTTASFPGLRRTAAGLDVILADASAYSLLTLTATTLTGTRPVLTYNGNGTTTGFGRLAAWLATPTLYMTCNASFDGANWNRDVVGSAASHFAMSATAFQIYGIGAAANPITWPANPTLFVDLTNNRIGVGIGAPGEGIDDVGALRIRGAVATNLANNTTIDFTGSLSRILAYGPSTSGRGTFQVVNISSDGSSSKVAINTSPTGSVGLTCTGGTDDACMPANQMFYAWINEAANQLTFRVKYSTGTVKAGTIALA